METRHPEKMWSRMAKQWCAYCPLLLGLLLIDGCGWMVQASQSLRLRGYENDIQSATHTIETARDGAERAKGYGERASAYAEKARYSRAFKLVAADEYERLFDLAMKDHDQAIALNPSSPDVYFSRGKAYYDRALLDLTAHQNSKPWFDRAAADFERATQKDPRNLMAFDLLGLTHEDNGEWDLAIGDYTRELALNPNLGNSRLADAYCGRGQQDQVQMNLDAAAEDYEKSVELGASVDDGCSCEPYNALLMIDTGTRHYDKAWDLVHRLQQSKHRLAPELMEQLKKASGRTS